MRRLRVRTVRRTVPYAIEAPFSLDWPGGWSAAGSMRSTPTPNRRRGWLRFLVVDWKTGRTETADPLQLAIYRLAWAEANQVPPEQVDAVFYYVRTDRVVRPRALPARAEGTTAGRG